MSDQLKSEPILIVGAGQMGIAYARVLMAMNIPIAVVGRGQISANKFEKETGISCTTGHIHDQINAHRPKPKTAIVAVSAMSLADTAGILLDSGVENILLEKPGGLSIEEVDHVACKAASVKANVRIAYNRRAFASVQTAKRLIEEDGGTLSIKFDFTEASKIIEKLNKPKRELETWFFGNSTHVIDLAFYLAGDPIFLACDVRGSTPWHPAGAIFVGHGETKNGTTLSYHANWHAPGRWGIEVMTRQRKLILQPMEKLRQQRHGSFVEEDILIDDALDKDFKPGLWKQVNDFLKKNPQNPLPDIYDHSKRMRLFECILRGTNTNL